MSPNKRDMALVMLVHTKSKLPSSFMMINGMVLAWSYSYFTSCVFYVHKNLVYSLTIRRVWKAISKFWFIIITILVLALNNKGIVKLIELYSCVQTKNYHGFTLGNQIIVNCSCILKKKSLTKSSLSLFAILNENA